MAQAVTAKLLCDPRKYAVFLDNITDALDGKMSALVVEKDVLIEASWPVRKIGSNGLGRFLLKKDGALLVALAVDQHHFFVKVNIFHLKPDKL